MLKTILRTTALASLFAAGAAFAQAEVPSQDGSAKQGEESSQAGTTGESGSNTMPGEMPMVGGAEMDPREDIVVNLSKASDMSTLVAAIKAAELDKTLAGAGPFTVFAPNNAAFEKLPEGAVDDLLRPEHKQKLSAIVTYHVLPADMTLEDAMKAVEEDGGSHSVMTIEGESLTLTSENGTLVLEDARGEKASVVQSDVAQSNGMVHVIDTVLMPE